ncbi:hypothetical protein ACKVMT_04870 [Halobacteriales archaeon Cl-PHB]
MECEVPDCDSEATFELHIPWRENQFVCAGHARTMAREDGVVADARDAADDELPDGAADR